MLRDLGSTNGKEASVLSPGDKIEMASRTVTFCELTSEELADPVESVSAQTVIALPNTKTQTFAGDLAQIPPRAVLQVLAMGAKIGIIELEANRDTT
jgi:hypothetical protein